MVAQIVVDTAPGHDYHSAAMVNEIDIFRAANLLVKHHGQDAPIHAAMRADAMLDKGDVEGVYEGPLFRDIHPSSRIRTGQMQTRAGRD